MLLLAFLRGIRRTFVYELLDEFPDTGYGLLRHDLTEKPAFLAVKKLISILEDSGPVFVPSPLHISVQGERASLTSVLFGKRDGSYDLVVWLEESSYDAETNSPTPVRSQSVKVILDPAFLVAEDITFMDDGSSSTHGGPNAALAFPLMVDEHLAVLHIVPRR